MTKDEILAMEPGREIDALIATKVMGWIPSRGLWWLPGCGEMNCSPNKATEWSFEAEKGVEHKGKRYQSISRYMWNPSNNIAAAWEVRQWIHDHIGGTEITSMCDILPEHCQIWNGKKHIQAQGHTAPEAICKAALLAVLEKDADNHA